MSATSQPHTVRLDRTLLFVCIGCLGLTVVYPTSRLVVEAVRDWQWSVIGEGIHLEALRNTVVMCFLSVATAGVVGTALAFLVTRYTFPGRRALGAMAYLPFALPPLVGTLSFYYLIGIGGFVPRILQGVMGGAEPAIQGPFAILLIHTYSFYVFFYAMVSVALDTMDVSQLEAARTLGASPLRVFRKVTLPMLTPALLGASLLTFMTSGASFSAPLFFGDDFPYLSVAIYNAQTNFREAEALTLTVILACVSMMGVFVFRSRRSAAGVASKGTPRELKSKTGRLFAGITAWAVIALLLTPHTVIAWLSVVKHDEWMSEIIPRSYSLANFSEIFTNPSAWNPIRNSLWMSLAASGFVLAVGLPVAYLIGRNRLGSRWVSLLVMIPWALPGTVIGINLIRAFNDDWIYNIISFFNDDWVGFYPLLLLPVGYFVRNIPLFSRIVTASVVQFDATLLEAGRSLGASQWTCFRRIVLPLLAPSIAAATALVFAASLGEFVTSVLLYMPGNLPIAVHIHSEWRSSGIGPACAYSVLLMVLVTATFFVGRRFASRII